MREGMDVGKQREVERVFFRSWHLTILGWRFFFLTTGFLFPTNSVGYQSTKKKRRDYPSSVW